uniref:Uncharacterized protein n=1 Tax=Ditylenchus dipsaci TaxID=166011 RepID=A0A915DBK4_9BILA
MEPDDDVSPDQQLQFDSSLPQQYSEAQLLAMLTNNPKYSDVDAKKFSEDLNDMEKWCEPAPRDPSMVIEEYNQKVHGKGPMPLGKPLEEEWLTQVVWIVVQRKQKLGVSSCAKKKSSKMSWRSFSEVALEKGETQVSRFKVSLSEEEDVSKADRRGSSPITLLHQEGEKKDSKEKLVTGQNMVDTNDIQPVKWHSKKATEVRKDDLTEKK